MFNRRRSWLMSVPALALVACGGSSDPLVVVEDSGRPAGHDAGIDARVFAGDIGMPTFDIQALDVPPRDVQPNYDAFFAENPLPSFCGPDGATDAGAAPDLPGGTAECPDDLTREGCPCDTVGAVHSCWPGLRVNRNRGICHDGMTTCQPYDELGGRWGACTNFTLPVPTAHLGASSCQCFSAGRWELTNAEPCFITYGAGSAATTYAVSTYVDSSGTAQCPMESGSSGPPPVPMPGTNFSTNFLTVDCTGQFELCYTIRAGDAQHPMPSDCTVAHVCTSAWYGTANARQAFPALPAWTGTDTACVARFLSGGGYGEMSVTGQSSECQHIDDGGQPYVFNRVTYCPSSCNTTPTAPACAACGNGGSGMF